MKFCKDHWDKLRASIGARGLTSLVPKSGEEACSRMINTLQGDDNLKDFDPLMSAHNQILSNAMDMIANIGGNPLFLMGSHPDNPEWECPICYLNFLSDEHDRTCTNAGCKKPIGLRFDNWIEKAADSVRNYVDEKIGGRA